MFVVLIVQPIIKERVINNITHNRNRFDLLQNMKLYQLNLVMRNSVEIHNLIKLTTQVLQKEVTVFIHQKDNEMDSKLKTEVSNVSVSYPDTVTILRKPLPDIPEELSSKQEHGHKYEHAQYEDALKRNIALDKAKVLPGSLKGIFYEDSHRYFEENLKIDKLELDEAQAVLGSVMEIGNRGVSMLSRFLKALAEFFGYEGIKTISTFRFAPVDKTGHKISTKKPDFFELGDKSEFQKVLSLVAIFEKREIERSEQVVLHFDTVANQIPEIFLFLFARHFKILEKLTAKYKDFKAPKKSVLVCGYPAFRGLEHPKITVVIDRDIYFVQHYLVELLARCTSDLCVVVLKNTSTMTKLTTEWKSKQVIQQWEIKISENFSQEEDFNLEFTRGTNTKIINAKFGSEYYKKLEKEFAELVTKDKIYESKTLLEARKIIRQR